MSALLAGVYDGDLAIAELLEHGDFGLGTFDALDGELVVLDGVAYRMRSDGSVHPVPGSDTTPFAVVTTFFADQVIPVRSPLTMAALFDVVGAESQNYLYAVRVTGRFASVTTRTVSVQQKPYPPLRDAVRGETMNTFADLDGTIVGFETPLYERGIGVPGGHVHFIDASRTRGGHALDFTLQSGTIEICVGTDLDLRLPLGASFAGASLSPDDLDAQVSATEVRPPSR
jgi:acetolactate decarboxylase